MSRIDGRRGCATLVSVGQCHARLTLAIVIAIVIRSPMARVRVPRQRFARVGLADFSGS